MAGTCEGIPIDVCLCGAVKKDEEGRINWTLSEDAKRKAKEMGLFFRGQRCGDCRKSGETYGGFPDHSLFISEAA